MVPRWQTLAPTIRHLALYLRLHYSYKSASVASIAQRVVRVDQSELSIRDQWSITDVRNSPEFFNSATIFITHISFRILASSEKLTGFKHPIQQILLLWYTLYNGYNVSEIYEIVIVNCVPLHCWTNVRYFCPNEFPQILNIWVSL